MQHRALGLYVEIVSFTNMDHTNLEEVLHSLWVVAVALSADSLHLLHLTGLTGSLATRRVSPHQQ